MSQEKEQFKLDFLKIYHAADQIVGKLPAVKKRREKKSFFRLFRNFFLAFLALVSVMIAYVLLQAPTARVAYRESVAGKENIEQALASFQRKEYSEALNFSSAAENNFRIASRSRDALSRRLLLDYLPFSAGASRDVGHLLSAGLAVSSALSSGASLGADLSRFFYRNESFGGLSAADRTAVLKRLYEAGEELDKIGGGISRASDDLGAVRAEGLLRPLKGKIAEANGKLHEAKESAEGLVPLAKLLPAASGYPEKSSFLVMLQNSDELRPTGGFFGTYGIIQTQNGEILRSDTHDIYHMDMPVKDKLSVAPPAPLRRYLDSEKWFMRDANWSPDWPESARKTAWFFFEEDKLLPPRDQINEFTGLFDGVIGVTPTAITDLLEIIGPVRIEGVSYDSGNFTKLLEYRVEKGYEKLGIPSWERKEVIGDIAKEIKKKLLAMPVKDLAPVGGIIFDNLSKKNIVAYFFDQKTQAVAADKNWDGAMRQTDGDFVMVVDANLAAYKTDAVMNRRWEYRLRQEGADFFADLILDYKHNGEGFDWRTTRYRTYTRVYAPKGSVLAKAEGWSDQAAPYEELGKTVFAGFLSIEPGQFARVRLSYKLPAAIARQAEKGSYELVFQRQPGAKVESLTVDLSFGQGIEKYEPAGFYAQASDYGVKWETNLETDRKFEILF